MYNGKMPFEALIQAGLTGANTGQVWQWSLPDGFRQVTGTEGSFPNGIVLSADASALYINYWFSGLTTKFDLGTGAVVGSHQGGRADNLTMANGSVWAAKHDMSVAEYLEGCPVEAANCFLPFSVHRLDLDDLREQRVWRFDSQAFGFGTVAIPVGEHVWLGSAHGDRIARFDLKDR
jgi:sugar lactone lactonase YvrE